MVAALRRCRCGGDTPFVTVTSSEPVQQRDVADRSNADAPQELTAAQQVDRDRHAHRHQRRPPALARRRIGMVFQSYELFPHLTVMGNLTLAPGLVAGESRADAEERAHKLLERVGLADRADDYPCQLSGGQRQRVAIVRALMMNPEILLLDEVTASLDPEMVREVLDVVLELARTGMTMLIVTHEMGFARAIADRIVFMDEGRIVEVDPPRKFFADPSSDRARRFLDIFSFEGAKLSACRGSRRGLCGGAGRWFVPPLLRLLLCAPAIFRAPQPGSAVCRPDTFRVLACSQVV